MKLTIECTEEQAQLLVNCLEESFRFRMKQENLFLEHILWEKYPDKETLEKRFDRAQEDWLETCDHAESACKSLMEIIYGRRNSDEPKEANEICDMWRVIRHKIYKAKGGNDSWCTMNDKPIKLSDMPLIKCEVEE